MLGKADATAHNADEPSVIATACAVAAVCVDVAGHGFGDTAGVFVEGDVDPSATKSAAHNNYGCDLYPQCVSCCCCLHAAVPSE